MFINILDMKTRLAGIENAWASIAQLSGFRASGRRAPDW